MDYNILKNLVSEYDGTSQEVADLLNAKTETVKREKFVNSRTLMATLGLSDYITFRNGLEEASMIVPALDGMLTLLMPSEGGIDVSMPEAVSILETLKGNGFVPEAIVDKIIALGDEKISIATKNGLGFVTAGDIEFAEAQ